MNMKTNQLTRLAAALLFAGTTSLLALPAVAAAQKSYPTPEAAMEAFDRALLEGDEAAKQAVLGPNFRKIIPPLGDEVRYQFIEAWVRSHKVQADGERSARIEVGGKGWTLPMPLVKTAGGWRFDMKAGEQEMRVRQIGRNELAAIEAVKAYVDAQKEYALKDRDGNGVLEFATLIRSRPGKQDGLYWPASPGAGESPLGKLFAGAEGSHQEGTPLYGYRYRILTAQGAAAPGGARDYMVDGRMTGGFALIAWPAEYNRLGVMTFIINQDGQVFERNLGPATAQEAGRIRTFNPDSTWRKVDNP
jgi:hypothetical protein